MKKWHASTYKGLPLIDADEDLKIEVLTADVAKSRRNDPSNCAATVASKRILKTDVEVHLSRTYVKAPDGQAWIRFLTPQSISREITAFDRHAAFEPGDYVLKAPAETQRLGQWAKKARVRTVTSKKRVKHHMTANVRESAKLPGQMRRRAI